MKTITVRKLGWAVEDDGDITSGPAKGAAVYDAKKLALRAAEAGEDTMVEVLDDKGRLQRVIPFYADKYAQLELESVRAAKEAAKA